MIISLLHGIIRLRYWLAGFGDLDLALDRCMLHAFQRHRPAARHAVLFVHGLGTSSSSWIRVIPHLPGEYAITCVDLPGYGFSRIQTGASFFTFDELVAALEQLAATLGPKPIVLVGHSLGGWIAAQYAVHRPDRVKHLVLIDTAGIYYPGTEQQRTLFNVRTPREVRRLMKSLWYRYPVLFRPFAGSVLRELERRGIHEFLQSVKNSDFLNGSLHALTMPVDVVWGENDRLISQESVEIMRREIPQLRFHTIQRCGHVPQLERPLALASVLQSILSGVV